MFVSPEAGAAGPRSRSTLVQDASRTRGSADVAGGIALGPAMIRAGDYYGHSVNLASRVTGVARPGSVLCTREVRDAAGDAVDPVVGGGPPPPEGGVGRRCRCTARAGRPRPEDGRAGRGGDGRRPDHEPLGDRVQVDHEDQRRVRRDPRRAARGAVAEIRTG